MSGSGSDSDSDANAHPSSAAQVPLLRNNRGGARSWEPLWVALKEYIFARIPSWPHVLGWLEANSSELAALSVLKAKGDKGFTQFEVTRAQMEANGIPSAAATAFVVVNAFFYTVSYLLSRAENGEDRDTLLLGGAVFVTLMHFYTSLALGLENDYVSYSGGVRDVCALGICILLVWKTLSFLPTEAPAQRSSNGTHDANGCGSKPMELQFGVSALFLGLGNFFATKQQLGNPSWADPDSEEIAVLAASGLLAFSASLIFYGFNVVRYREKSRRLRTPPLRPAAPEDTPEAPAGTDFEGGTKAPQAPKMPQLLSCVFAALAFTDMVLGFFYVRRFDRDRPEDGSELWLLHTLTAHLSMLAASVVYMVYKQKAVWDVWKEGGASWLCHGMAFVQVAASLALNFYTTEEVSGKSKGAIELDWVSNLVGLPTAYAVALKAVKSIGVGGLEETVRKFCVRASEPSRGSAPASSGPHSP